MESKARFWGFKFSLFPHIYLSPKKLTQKKMSNFLKLQFLNDKIYNFTKKDILCLAIWQNWCFGQFYPSRIEVLQHCAPFVASFSRKRKIWGNERKFKTQKPDLTKASVTALHIFGSIVKQARSQSTEEPSLRNCS